MRQAGPQHYLFILMVLALGMLGIFWALTQLTLSTIETVAVVVGFAALSLGTITVFWLFFR